MSTKIFNYYDDWKTHLLTCPKCGWTGTFEQGSVEYYQELMDSSCPSCSWEDAPRLAIVSWPTRAETEANFDRLSDSEKASFLQRKRFLERVAETSLKSPDELPDLSVSEIRLLWDIQDDEGENWTILRHGDQIVWKELAVYEGYERFVEVLAILQQKYGERLVDVVPTDASKVYLYGDSSSATRIVEDARSQLARRQPPEASNA